MLEVGLNRQRWEERAFGQREWRQQKQTLVTVRGMDYPRVWLEQE